MALQGTIETFPLTDVLTLLGSSSKTGKLELTGDRGTGWLWVDDGRVVGGSIGERTMDDPARLVFELLRFTDGAFEFTATDHDDLDLDPDLDDLDPVSLVEGIVAASDLLDQWRAIETVVPSMRHRVVLTTELPGEVVTIERSRWSLVVTAARTPTVQEIATILGLDEFDVCAAIAALVADGLAAIDEPAQLRVELCSGAAQHEADEVDEVGDGPELHTVGEFEDLRSDPDDDRLDVFGSPEPAGGNRSEENEGAFPNRFPIDDLLGGGAMERDDPWSSPETDQLATRRLDDACALDDVGYDALRPIASVPFGDERPPEDGSHTSRTTAAAWNDMVEDDAAPAAGSGRTEEDTTDEVLRQMSKLSPKAAEAIAAALSTVPAAPAPHGGPHEDDGGSSGPSTFFGSF